MERPQLSICLAALANQVFKSSQPGSRWVKKSLGNSSPWPSLMGVLGIMEQRCQPCNAWTIESIGMKKVVYVTKCGWGWGVLMWQHITRTPRIGRIPSGDKCVETMLSKAAQREALRQNHQHHQDSSLWIINLLQRDFNVLQKIMITATQQRSV